MSCNKKAYIADIPDLWQFDNDEIIKLLDIYVSKSKNDSEVLLEELSDEEIYIKEKYSKLFNIHPKDVTNLVFYGIIDEYLNTPYSEVGFSKKGLTMILFAQHLYKESFEFSLQKTVSDIFNAEDIELFSGRQFLQEGDIVFLRYNKTDAVSDIAICLKNNLVLANTPSDGLTIYDFQENYFQERFLAGGRIIKEVEDEE